MFLKQDHWELIYPSGLLNDKIERAINLVNADTIYQSDDYTQVDYYHLEFENHCFINANGLLGESLVGLGWRDKFENT